LSEIDTLKDKIKKLESSLKREKLLNQSLLDNKAFNLKLKSNKTNSSKKIEKNESVGSIDLSFLENADFAYMRHYAKKIIKLEELIQLKNLEIKKLIEDNARLVSENITLKKGKSIYQDPQAPSPEETQNSINKNSNFSQNIPKSNKIAKLNSVDNISPKRFTFKGNSDNEMNGKNLFLNPINIDTIRYQKVGKFLDSIVKVKDLKELIYRAILFS